MQRILQDLRLTLDTVSLPLLQQLLGELQRTTASVTIGETGHAGDFGLLQEPGNRRDGLAAGLGALSARRGVGR